jgi:hypothetical protein
VTPATHIIQPLQRIWLLEAPVGVSSSGPLVLSEHGLASAQPLVDRGYLLTGPYVLDPAAALQADAEVRAHQEKIAGMKVASDRHVV